MKTMKVVTVVCWVIAALALVGLAIWFLTGTVFGYRSSNWGSPFSGFSIGNFEVLAGPFEEAGTYEIGAEDIRSLNVDWTSGNVRVEPYDGATIKITEYAQRELKDNEKLRTNTSSGVLSIRYIEQNQRLWNMPQKRLEVLIPRGLCQSFEYVTIDAMSSDITADGVGATRFKADTASGSVSLTNITAQTLSVNTMSGTVTLSSVISDVIDIDSTSGSITVNSAQSGETVLNSMSGSVRITGSSARSIVCETTSGSINVAGDFKVMDLSSMSGRVDADSSAENSVVNAETTSGSIDVSGSFDIVETDSMSGNVNIRSSIVPSSVKADTTSGSITIAIPGGETISVNHSSISGSFSSDVPVLIQGSGARFSISTMSGRTRIIAI